MKNGLGMCIFAFVFALSLSACVTDRVVGLEDASDFGLADFQQLMQTVAEGWRKNDAELAASAFGVNALYSEPPDRQIYRGRQEIFEFFGGNEGRESWMSMTWHHLSFNETTSVGAAEFTFAWPEGQVHGMVSIRVEDGLIENWREYFYEAETEWEHFTRFNRF